MNALLIILSIIVSGGLWLRFLYKYDKVEPEPIWVVLKVLFWGGILSAIPASILNNIAQAITGYEIQTKSSLFSTAFFALAVGINEEVCKAFATVYLTKKLMELDEPIDAVIYSTAVGLGFAVIENFEYGFQYGLLNIGLRTITAIPLHIGLAVLWGVPIARVRFFMKLSYFEEMRGAVFLAALIHGIYDFFVFYFQIPLLSLVTSLAIAYLLVQYSDKKLKYLLGQTPFLSAGTCTNCGYENTPEDKTCKKCGFNLTQDFFLVCSNCGTKLPIHYTICSFCGTSVNTKSLFQEKTRD